MISIKLTNRARCYGLPSRILRTIEDDLTALNPEWLDAKIHKRIWALKTIEKQLFFYETGRDHISVPIGYMEEVYHYLERNKLKCTVYDYRTEEDVLNGLKFTGTLKTFQDTAAKNALLYDNGTLEAPTGSGKTVMGLYIIAKIGQKTLIIVHTKDLMAQWHERCCGFLNVTPEEIGLIGDGKDRIGRRITIGIVNSVRTRIDKLKKEFGHIVVDECHRTPGKTFSEAVDGLHARYKLGLTATATRRDGLDDLIFWYIGQISYSVKKKFLIEEGHILNPEFIMRATGFTPSEDGIPYPTMITELAGNYPRNRMICRDIAKEVESGESFCLVLSDRKDHCEELRRILADVFDIESDVLTGDTDTGERESITALAGTHQRPLIATGQLIGEGFDAKALDTLFLTTPIKYDGRITQYIGRVMRAAPGKRRPAVFDYVDWDIKPLRISAHARMKVYGKDNVVHE